MKILLPFLVPDKLAVALVAAALVVGNTSAVHADLWDGGGADSEFSTADNWDTDQVPFFTDNSTNTTNDINGAFTVERSVDSAAGRTFLSGGATLNVTGGTHSDARPGNNIRNFVGRGSTATVNQSGGSYNIGHMLSIGGGGADGNGAYYLTGGELSPSRGANSIIDGNNPHGRPSLEVGDEEAAGSGLFEISGGSLITRFGAGVGPAGVFSIVGSASSIDIGNNNNGDGTWLQQSGGTIKAAIDAGGVSAISVNDNDLDGGVLVEFLSGSILDLGFAGIAPVAGSWTILEAVNADITNGGLGLSGATASGWSFNVDNSGTNGLLTATYGIPEPTSLVLMMFGTVAILVRRRAA